ncbi:MAG TPA: CbiX/SirB N-terminal domain-containing protein [Actinophytocola sp.]|nr:CbiX/SirB N-terminal domain-containing protein [Actinophytocola sp.]
MRLVTVAHGTRHPTGNDVAKALTAAAGERLGMTAVTSYVELSEPLFADVMAGLNEPAVVVPLLLSTGYHVTVDLPRGVESASVPVTLGAALGPDVALALAQVARLEEAGAAPGQSAVMVAAGSQDPAAMPDLERAAALLAEEWGGAVELATLGGTGRRPADVVRPGDAVSPYLLAPGQFADRARTESLGASVVADVIGVHDAVVDLIVARARL